MIGDLIAAIAAAKDAQEKFELGLVWSYPGGEAGALLANHGDKIIALWKAALDIDNVDQTPEDGGIGGELKWHPYTKATEADKREFYRRVDALDEAVGAIKETE